MRRIELQSDKIESIYEKNEIEKNRNLFPNGVS